MVAGMLYDCVPSSVSSDSVQHFVGAFRMSPGDQEIERLERQINSLRRKQILDGVEVPKAKYGIPRNKGTASKATTKGTEEIAEEISNGPITKATVRPEDKEPVVDNSKQKTPEHPFLIFLKHTMRHQTLRILGCQLRKFLRTRKRHIGQ